jgi:hypothetical protein
MLVQAAMRYNGRSSNNHVGFEVLTDVAVKSFIVWDIMTGLLTTMLDLKFSQMWL